MKKCNKTNLLLAVFTVLVCVCCAPESHDIIAYQGPADLTVTNLTTGESYRETSTINLGETPEIVFRHGDVMQLKFTPPEKYENTKFTVNYQLLDINTLIRNSPYIFEMTIADDVPIGSYYIYCSAMGEDWDNQSHCIQTLDFRVKE